ncbi:unnamed protein product [Pedinophyceae sp. YPF-701]|nr:unnamed protein product [Pedinophyceae sp. YPF-701]
MLASHNEDLQELVNDTYAPAVGLHVLRSGDEFARRCSDAHETPEALALLAALKKMEDGLFDKLCRACVKQNVGNMDLDDVGFLLDSADEGELHVDLADRLFKCSDDEELVISRPGAHVKGLRIRGSRGITITEEAHGVVLEDVWIKRASGPAGITVRGARGVELRRCVSTNNDGAGLCAAAGAHVLMFKGDLTDNNVVGLDAVDKGTEVTLQSVEIASNDDTGVHVHAATVVLDGSEVRDNNSHGIWADGDGVSLKLVHSRVHSNEGCGVRLLNQGRASMMRTTVERNAEHGVQSNGEGAETTISACTIKANGWHGVFAGWPAQVVIRGGTIEENGEGDVAEMDGGKVVTIDGLHHSFSSNHLAVKRQELAMLEGKAARTPSSSSRHAAAPRDLSGSDSASGRALPRAGVLAVDSRATTLAAGDSRTSALTALMHHAPSTSDVNGLAHRQFHDHIQSAEDMFGRQGALRDHFSQSPQHSLLRMATSVHNHRAMAPMLGASSGGSPQAKSMPRSSTHMRLASAAGQLRKAEERQDDTPPGDGAAQHVPDTPEWSPVRAGQPLSASGSAKRVQFGGFEALVVEAAP